jgi:hypothetical protein
VHSLGAGWVHACPNLRTLNIDKSVSVFTLMDTLFKLLPHLEILEIGGIRDDGFDMFGPRSTTNSLVVLLVSDVQHCDATLPCVLESAPFLRKLAVKSPVGTDSLRAMARLRELCQLEIQVQTGADMRAIAEIGCAESAAPFEVLLLKRTPVVVAAGFLQTPRCRALTELCLFGVGRARADPTGGPLLFAPDTISASRVPAVRVTTVTSDMAAILRDSGAALAAAVLASPRVNSLVLAQLGHEDVWLAAKCAEQDTLVPVLLDVVHLAIRRISGTGPVVSGSVLVLHTLPTLARSPCIEMPTLAPVSTTDP